ncbi:c-type cytochrome [Parvibaculum sp.]|uniref:c-type cytochrome n=1 Tax=Parvibaculum sp. TaxID=2024848 RepID=UPI003BAAC087
MKNWMGICVGALTLMLLAGCDGKPDAMKPVVLNPERTELYAASCKTCHEDPVTGAPQTHDTTAWEPRLAKGEDKLLDNIVNGFNGMPPLGQCIECTAEDFLTLTHFMAAPSIASLQEENEEKESQ